MLDRLAATITLLGHNGLLRGDVIFSHIRAKDMTWDHHSLKRSMKLHFGQPAQPDRTAEDGIGFVLQIFVLRVRTSTCGDGSIFMVCGPSPRDISFLTWFHLTKANQFNFTATNVLARSILQLDTFFTAISEDPKKYSVHSMYM